MAVTSSQSRHVNHITPHHDNPVAKTSPLLKRASGNIACVYPHHHSVKVGITQLEESLDRERQTRIKLETSIARHKQMNVELSETLKQMQTVVEQEKQGEFITCAPCYDYRRACLVTLTWMC